MRWVFIRPRNDSPYYDPEIQEPLGLEYLAATRRAAGDAVLVLDLALDGLPERKAARRAVSFRPDVVGVSVMTAQEVASVRTLYAEAGAAAPGDGIRWMAGGNFVSTEPDRARALLPPAMDLVRFEGELYLRDWADGPARTGETGGVYAGAPVSDLDELPFPERPFADRILDSGWAFSLQGSRGCCGACRFCASPGMTAAGGGRHRGRSPAHVAEEMGQLCRRYGARSFNFIDEDFLGPVDKATARADAFAGELERRRLQVAFGIQVRPQSLNAAVIDRLASVGLGYVFMGLESDDPGDFTRWNRPWIRNPWALITRLRSRGVEVHVGVMLFHAHSTFPKIRRLARRLHRYRLLNYRSVVNRLDAMPGSDCHAEARARGVIPADSTGPQPLPFLHEGVQAFHENLTRALDPLGPPSMHAVCQLPPMLARQRVYADVEDALRRLRAINSALDDAVAATVFDLLDLCERGESMGKEVEVLRRRNLETAVHGVHELVRAGFAPSFEELREAIRIDSGL